MIPFIDILLLGLFINKLADVYFDILINYREMIKSNVLKMSYPKQIHNNFNKFIQTVNAKMTTITSVKRSKNSPMQEELDNIFNSELFFTDLVGAIGLFSNGKTQLR